MDKWKAMKLNMKCLQKVSIIITVDLSKLFQYNVEPLMGHLVSFVTPSIKAQWEDFAYVLLIRDSETVEAIKAECGNDSVACCRRVFKHWLSSSPQSHKTWSTLLEKLKQLRELTRGREEIIKKLQQPSIVKEYL